MKRIRPLEWGVLVFVLIVLAPIFLPSKACGCSKIFGGGCLSNVKQQAMGLIQYGSDYDYRLPQRDRWMDAIVPYVKERRLFHDPEGPKGAYGYAFNGAFSRAKLPEDLTNVPMVYDSLNPIRNASDLVASLPSPGRHHGSNVIAYADGRAKVVGKLGAGDAR